MNATDARAPAPSWARWLALAGFVACAAWTAGQEPAAGERLFVLSVMLATAAILLAATARPALALLFGGGAFVLLKVLGQFKLRYLDSSLMPADFVYFVRASLLETLEHYPPLLLGAAAVALGLPLLAVWLWRRE
ncbi:MAG: sulfatase, partial [Pseudomonadota bacterium]